MYAAIGGLKAHMTKLNVIGNNVANVNTVGYKAQRMTFRESIYTTSKSGSNGGVTMGGNNPSQIGYGCSVGSIDLNMSPSTYAPTGVPLDTYIDGEGFYMFGDKDSGLLGTTDASKLDLSRVGDFWIDPDGYICNRDGKCVYGFARVQNPNYIAKPTDADKENAEKQGIDITSKTIVSSQLVPLRVPLSAAKPTEKNGGIPTAGAGGGGGAGTGTTTDAEPLWEEGEPVYPYLQEYTSADGKTYYTNKYAGVDYGSTVADKVPDTGAIGVGKTTMVVGQNTDPLRVSDELHVQLKSVSVQKNGAIQGIAANGDTVVIGYIAIANCDSPDGVTHIDGPYYKAMGGAGALRVSALNGVLEGKYMGNQGMEFIGGATANPPAGGGTTTTNDSIDPLDYIVNEKAVELRNGGLESSSTDIAEEFTQMIKTQRGYQANTRIITVTDSMLEELVNMKR